ncbi:hypothetical protein LRU_01623 [Ligilactobacillus ruminis SPM0211]|uniref:Uncharacterized protein n=1 Tax=Ligilactobacillus ruminis SPM0211 TaxID=1040964 RepID=F7R1P9_9LACO|nr:hypothetical protein LRU_01623 [Ligilactobacillus ruminis SPM0211]
MILPNAARTDNAHLLGSLIHGKEADSFGIFPSWKAIVMHTQKTGLNCN